MTAPCHASRDKTLSAGSRGARCKGEYKKDLAAYLRRGFSRVRIDGDIELDAVPELDKKRKHNIEIVVDRVIIKDNVKACYGSLIA